MTYKTKFTELVNDIITNIKHRKTENLLRFAFNGVFYDVHDRGARIALIRNITDDYVASQGELPDAAELERLADAILDEELTDMHPDKVTNTEYPFFSEHQLELRAAREPVSKIASTSASDGRDYRVPTRRSRTDYEIYYVDKHAKGRNAERRRQYAKDKAPGKVSTVMSEPFAEACKQSARWRDELSLVH